MLLRELLFFIVPLLVAGIVHHGFVIPRHMLLRIAGPIDRGTLFLGKPLLGSAKTWRGFIVMIIGTGLMTWFLSLFLQLPLLVPAWLAGMLFGLGYVLGELPNSFLKRRLGIVTSGQGHGFIGVLFLIIDQCDSIIGALLMLSLVYHPSYQLMVMLFLIGAGLHLIIDLVLRRWSYKHLPAT